MNISNPKQYKIRHTISDALVSLNDFRSLQEDWHEEAKIISEKAIQLAETILRQLQPKVTDDFQISVFPVPTGGVHIQCGRHVCDIDPITDIFGICTMPQKENFNVNDIQCDDFNSQTQIQDILNRLLT